MTLEHARLLRPLPASFFDPSVVAELDEKENIVRYNEDIWPMLNSTSRGRITNLRRPILTLDEATYMALPSLG